MDAITPVSRRSGCSPTSRTAAGAPGPGRARAAAAGVADAGAAPARSSGSRCCPRTRPEHTDVVVVPQRLGRHPGHPGHLNDRPRHPDPSQPARCRPETKLEVDATRRSRGVWAYQPHVHPRRSSHPQGDGLAATRRGVSDLGGRTGVVATRCGPASAMRRGNARSLREPVRTRSGARRRRAPEGPRAVAPAQ